MGVNLKKHGLKMSRSGSQFIDRSHANLSETVKKLSHKLAKGVPPTNFHQEATYFIAELEDHFEEEEMFLQAAVFSNVENHRQTHKNILRDFQNILETSSPDTLEPRFVHHAQLRLFEHELMDDQEFWGELAPLHPTEDILITWGRRLETGDKGWTSTIGP